ncbi:MAG TPA: DUF6152 family protein [Steroidobacteraceae bacterium]|nr:DUF6152 family protein [Steroidobacteraceae bacterium]
MKHRGFLALPVVLLLAGSMAPAMAHHSAAMFDQQKKVELSGVVREFQWTNPHCYIQLLVKDAQGREQEWSLELGAPMYLYARGWRPSTVKLGDRLTVTVSPLRNGSAGGLLVEARGADGKPLGKAAEKAK